MDFVANYAPVVHDTSYRVMLIVKILLRLTGMIVDVETAFLHGELEEDIFMDCPDGLGEATGTEVDDTDCVKLLKFIYGLVQAARQWWKKLTKILRDMGFIGGDVDPCLMMYDGPFGRVFIGLYVDDCLCVGKKEGILDVIEKIQKAGLNVKVEADLCDYLSCEIVFSANGSKGWLGQPGLMENLEKKFGEVTAGLQKYQTPGTPHFHVSRDIEIAVSKGDQKLYQSGVGMLLYLVKHSRPDLANCVRIVKEHGQGK